MTRMDRVGVRGEERNSVFSCIPSQSDVLPLLGITDSVTLRVMSETNGINLPILTTLHCSR
jgi:hypothetical protein